MVNQGAHPTLILPGEEPTRLGMAPAQFAPDARTAGHWHAMGQAGRRASSG
jgi:hypothetical protein